MNQRKMVSGVKSYPIVCAREGPAVQKIAVLQPILRS